MVSLKPELALASSLLLTMPAANAFAAESFIPAPTNTAVRAIWVRPIADKLIQEKTPALNGETTTNFVFDGSQVHLTGIAGAHEPFSAVLETASDTATNVRASFSGFIQQNGDASTVTPVADLYVARYLQIQGISALFGDWDEAKIPVNLRLPDGNNDRNTEGWTNRPDYNKHFPDPMIPQANATLADSTIAPNNSKTFYADIFVPNGTAPGLYTGTLSFTENGTPLGQIPVNLDVRNFDLPYSTKAFTYVSRSDIADRFYKMPESLVQPGPQSDNFEQSISEAFKVLRRYGVEAISDDYWVDYYNQISPAWHDRFSGDLFTAANGYHGPGQGVGTGIYSYGTYAYLTSTNWDLPRLAADISTTVPAIKALNPNISYFFWLIEEGEQPSLDAASFGQQLKSMVTNVDIPLFGTDQVPDAEAHFPSLDVIGSTFDYGASNAWNSARAWAKANGKQEIYYNSYPPSGTFTTEDYGTAPIAVAWGQAKFGIDKYFFWQADYYDNSRYGSGKTDLFNQAHTFGDLGGDANHQRLYGKWGNVEANGNGVLLYPGTDQYYPNSNYGTNTFFPSLRLLLWGRGIEDVRLYEAAHRANPQLADAIVLSTVPKYMWEYGVADPNDPTYNFGGPSWYDESLTGAQNADKFTQARDRLIQIVEQAPKISVSRVDNSLVIKWSTAPYASGFVLETSSSLGTNAVWSTPTAGTLSAGQYVINLPQTGQQFYRLRKTN